MNIIYFIVTIFATTVGSATGMGGGVIIKPVLDALAFMDVGTIGILSSISVFTMSLVAVFRSRKNKTNLPYGALAALAAASAAGGVFGDRLFSLLSASSDLKMVKIVQNAILGILIVIIFIYMLKKKQIRSLRLEGSPAYVLTGLFLGISSSFLGIGGGPINVAVFAYFFSYDTKTSATASLVTILFSQAAKLIFVALTRGFGGYDLRSLPYMLAAAVLGGLIGAQINRRLDEDRIILLFNGAQVLIFLLCCFNIYRTWQVMP